MYFDYDKFRDLVHYICYRADKDELGAVKLNKVLWFADAWSYITAGQPITGETYIKKDHGPVPSHIGDALSELRDGGKIQIRGKAYFGYPKTEYITLEKPNLFRFTAEEISFVDSLVEAICGCHTARSISELTHNRAWELAAYGEEIPYYTLFAGESVGVTRDDIEWAYRSISEEEPA